MLKTAIRSFHAVARYGGFTAAAQHLHISQPTLSSQVRALEERYEVELFDRVGREVRLTVAGNELFQVTSRLHRIEEEIEDLLNSFKGLQSGTLRIAAVGPFLLCLRAGLTGNGGLQRRSLLLAAAGRTQLSSVRIFTAQALKEGWRE